MSSIILHSLDENENQCPESLAKFLQETEPSCILPASFLKATVLNKENWAFSCAFENIKLQNT